MFRVALTRNILRVCEPSSSRIALGGLSSFHTTPPTSESYTKRRSRAVKRRNVEKMAERATEEEASRPHPVLGTTPGDETKWLNSDLAKILINESHLQPLPPMSSEPLGEGESEKPIVLPRQHAFGIGQSEQEFLFNDLRVASTTNSFIGLEPMSLKAIEETGAYEQAAARERKNSEMLARITALSNASAKGIAYENRKRCILEFSANRDPNDTGRPEVQAALLTMRIRNLWDHLNRAPRDIHNRRTIRLLVHQRAKVLKYLKRVDRNRYYLVLDRIGVDPRAVEGEIIVR